MEGDYTAQQFPGIFRISIHALRVEGDAYQIDEAYFQAISIHALRVEGDMNLYERVKRGDVFLSTPSGWRATTKLT